MRKAGARGHAVRGRRGWALVALAVIACGVGAVAIVRSSWFRGREAVDQRAKARETEEAVRQGQIAFTTLPMVPLGSIASLGELHASLVEAGAAAKEGGSTDRDDLTKRKLVELAAEFIYFRFVLSSPEAYRAWRQSSGYRLKDAETLRREGVATDYEHWFDEPYPGDDRLVEVFDRLWAATLDAKDERSRPVGIAQGASGVEVALGAMDRAWERPMPMLSGELSERVWQGLRSGQLGRDWWRDPNGGIRGELQHRESVPVAVVGVIVEMKAGDRYPFTFTYYRDVKGKWWLWRVNVLNFPSDRFVQIEI